MLIKLVGCKNYSFKGELFRSGFEYDLDDEKAAILLEKVDMYGISYFKEVTTPEPAMEVIEERRTKEEGGVEIRRSRGRPRKNPEVRKGGDTKEDDDETPEEETRSSRSRGTGKSIEL